MATPLGPGPLVYAHRGARLAARENTIESFRIAVELGADGIELDAWMTADGEVVVHHDARHGDVGWIGRCRWSDLHRRDPTVPTLVEALEAIPPDVFVDLELKNGWSGPAFDRLRNLAAAAVPIVDGHRDRLFVSSFDARMLDRFARLAPDVPTAQLLTGGDPDEAIAWAAAAGRRAVAVERSRLVADPGGFVARAGAVELVVAAWTVNDPAEVAEFAAAGVAVIISDDPASAVEAVSALR